LVIRPWGIAASRKIHQRTFQALPKQDLLRKYLDEHWPERLRAYHCTPHPGANKTTRIWRDGDYIMGIVNEYRNGNIVVRQLRDGDVMYRIP
jgi:hypothetical protein